MHLLLSLLLACAGRAPGAPEATAEPVPTAAPVEEPPETRETNEIGWHVGPIAAGAADALAPVEPADLPIPAWAAELVEGDTAFFYFSPTCPHCQHAMPEINALAARPELRIHWVAIASGGSSMLDLQWFKEEYGVQIEVRTDTAHDFARAVGARSTPTLYLVRPSPDPAPDTKAGTVNVRFFEAYAPYARGIGALLATRRHTAEPYGELHGYVGDVLCSTCHTEQAASWALTHHAQAYRTIYLRERADEPACVACHVTGLGEPGGFVIGDHSNPQSGVTCEACHGPSGPHDGVVTEASATCTGCHDAEHSVDFSLAKGLPWIDHHLAPTLTSSELQARITAISDGSFGRPLLAFPEGPTVGAQTCASCHPDQHRWAGETDTHARAMATLDPTQSADPECVSCHATAAASGPPSKEISGYRTEEGVGCEACHGPGGDHVATPTKANIIGLGSSCPECVIEAICTSCHVPAWDPDWELKKGLAGIQH